MEAAVVVKDLIERERAVCAELAQVLHAERDALTRFSADGVTACVRRKDGLHTQLVALARERRRAVEDLGRASACTTGTVAWLPSFPACRRRRRSRSGARSPVSGRCSSRLGACNG